MWVSRGAPALIKRLRPDFADPDAVVRDGAVRLLPRGLVELYDEKNLLSSEKAIEVVNSEWAWKEERAFPLQLTKAGR